MVEEALRRLRKQFVSSMLIIILWVMTWPSIVQKYHEYSDAKDLHAWLYLKEAIKNFQSNPFEIAPDKPITQDKVEIAFDAGEFELIDLKVQVTWPILQTFSLILRPKLYYPANEGSPYEVGSLVRIYQVDVQSVELPFEYYEIILVGAGDGDFYVVPAGDQDLYQELKTDSLRLLSRAVRAKEHPWTWESVKLQLARYGFGQHPSRLSQEIPALGRMEAETNPNRLSVQVFGVPVQIGLFFIAVGGFLGVLGFGMVGPLRILNRRGSVDASDAWILVTRTKEVGTKGVVALLLEVIISIVSIVWVLAPLVILWLQLLADVELKTEMKEMLLISSLGLLFASGVHLAVSLKLRSFRRRPSGGIRQSSKSL